MRHINPITSTSDTEDLSYDRPDKVILDPFDDDDEDFWDY